MVETVEYKILALRNGAYYKELKWDASSAPQIDYDAGGRIKCSLRCELIDLDIETFTDELQPMMRRNGGDWESLGIFRITTATEKGDAYHSVLAVEAYDRAVLLQLMKKEGVYHVNAGAAYLSTIEGLISSAGSFVFAADATTATMPADREDWPAGTDYLTIVNDMLGEIGFNELWFDAAGVAHLEAYQAPSPDRIAREYSATDLAKEPIGSDYEAETDLFDAPNVFVCVCANADRTETLTATAINDNPVSAKSIISRGLRIPQVTTVDQIADQDALQVYADRLRDDSMYASRTVTFYTRNEAGHSLHEVVAIEHPAISGLYTVEGWTMKLAPGELMKHTARKAVV